MNDLVQRYSGDPNIIVLFVDIGAQSHGLAAAVAGEFQGGERPACGGNSGQSPPRRRAALVHPSDGIVRRAAGRRTRRR